MRTSFSVLATHYCNVDFPLVSTGNILGYSAEELIEIRTKTDAAADAVAVQYEEEAIPD